MTVSNNDTSLSYMLDQLLFAEIYLLIYGFLGIAIITLIVAKWYGNSIGHDDISFIYMTYFIVFSLNFFTNGIIFTLRIFQQGLLILGFGSVIILFLNKFIFDISTTIKTQRIWSKPVFIAKQVKEWYSKYEITFTILSFFFGPISAMTFVNSRLFIHNLFMMGIPHSMIVRFIGGKLFWEVLFIQRAPELAIQCVYMVLHGYDHFVLYAFMTTLLTTILMINMKAQLPAIRKMQDHWIHHTAILFEVDSEEIQQKEKYMKCLLKRDALKKMFASILGLKQHFIELPSFEPLFIDIEHSMRLGIGIDATINSQNEIEGKRITECCGIRAYISVNSHLMSRREILMKLFEARQNGKLKNKLMKIWDLKRIPCISECVMVYNLFGHLVKPRARNLDEPTITMTNASALGLLAPRSATAFAMTPTGKIPETIDLRDLGVNVNHDITPSFKSMSGRDPYGSFSIKF